ncbi:ABC transporter permease [Ensifer sp. YR511]|uniref:ABC transporter permease n=1 Tax=Ensifer sp. YR511 TaxID=1855294 RepID=UPI00087EE9D3|nr:ABC transporter permease [Ensifer sp. YR511]SDN35623.1 ribose transport system permease protein [Ensifer sp. YR511]
MKILAPVSAVSLRRRSAWPVLVLIALLVVVLGTMSPGVLSIRNLLNILNQQASLIAVTIGQALVVMTGGLDLSVGSLVSLTTAIVSLDRPWAVPLAIVVACANGAVNAYGVVWLRVHPILMTLSTMTALQGAALLVRPIPGGAVPAWLVAYSNGLLGGIPLPVWAAAAVVLLAALMFAHSRLGLHILASGGSADNARLGGVASDAVVACAYVLSSLLAMLGGINVAGRLASGDPLVGSQFAIDSVAATALGGTLLSGGLGGIVGPVGGVLFLALLANGLNFLNISTYYQMIIKGALLIVAVSAHRRKSPGL